MNNRSAGVFLVIVSVLSFGCHCPPAGPMNYQQSRAVVNDPFPLEDIGPSDSTVRPPGFEQPLPEPVRDRIVKDSMPWTLGQ